ncbi:hypothetical protein AB0B66_40645 [Catellatospora sp. NPDC049111]|uniref:hypothetical protein n=1 Tax=Catellatospora sp. NPDC049111 TaxID=3155271 RepID=UPI0033C382C4
MAHADIGEFQGWVASLRHGDDDLLTHMGLPQLDRLRRIASEGRVPAFIVRGRITAASTADHG